MRRGMEEVESTSYKRGTKTKVWLKYLHVDGISLKGRVGKSTAKLI